MTGFKFERISFGSARTLTRDGIGGEYTEFIVRDSLYPPMG